MTISLVVVELLNFSQAINKLLMQANLVDSAETLRKLVPVFYYLLSDFIHHFIGFVICGFYLRFMHLVIWFLSWRSLEIILLRSLL